MDGAPMPKPGNPCFVESTIVLVEVPSPVKMAVGLPMPLKPARNATTPESLIATSSLKKIGIVAVCQGN